MTEPSAALAGLRYALRVLLLGALLGVVLFAIYLGVAMLRA